MPGGTFIRQRRALGALTTRYAWQVCDLCTDAIQAITRRGPRERDMICEAGGIEPLVAMLVAGIATSILGIMSIYGNN